ncbi:MAG: NAD(+)/NADH kinase [Gemmatimonadota bacterium]|nr:NAD(+)/NADH kinase [Gemmatimonadota bacterium]
MSPPEGHRLDGPIRSVAVVVRQPGSEVKAVVGRLGKWIGERDIAVTLEKVDERSLAGETSLDIAKNPVDLVIALGGDGTLLRAARAVVGTDVPVLGVNLGRLGFLTAFPDAELEFGLEAVIGGHALLDHRFTLRARIEGKHQVDGDNLFALNDIVVHTSGAARVTPLTLHVGSGDAREEVGSFSADGVILATPTGSTAYSMSAGGPIIVPEVECIVVTPICPHSLAVRPLVIPATQEVSVRSPDPDAEHQVTVDGQVERVLAPGDAVVVSREEHPVKLVRLPGQTFFGTLRRKLNWAAGPPERA